MDDDDLCRFCGKLIVPFGKQVKSKRNAVASSFRALKSKVRSLTAKELDETLISADYSNPANAIWDD